MALVSVTIFSAVVFTACTKKKTTCATVACRNGGTCNGDHCVCPTGYQGAFCETGVSSFVTYTNTTFTPVTLVINNVTQVLPVGASITLAGTYGTTSSGTATTSGGAKSLGVDLPNGVIGLQINWNVNGAFPSTANDTTVVPLQIGATYYYLRMTNNGTSPVTSYIVNTFGSDSLNRQDVTIPNNGITYDLGYYLAYPNSNIQVTRGNGAVTTSAVALPVTTNQTATVIVH